MSEMTNHSNVMLRRQQASKTFVCVYKILRFCANPQKFQTLVSANNSCLKVFTFTHLLHTYRHTQNSMFPLSSGTEMHNIFFVFSGVTLDGLMKILHKTNALSKWQFFGVMLKFSLSEVEAIASECNQRPENCLMKVLECWLKRTNPPPFWSMLIEALQTVGEEKLASELEEKYSLQ